MSVAPEIAQLLQRAVEERASDLHLVASYPPRIRVHGQLVSIPGLSALTSEDTACIFEAVSAPEQRQIFQRQMELDFSYEIAGLARFRVNVSCQRGSISLVFRHVPSRIPTLEELRLPEVCRDLVALPRGLVLVTGPTGSGKSSTLAAMLNYLNETQQKKIVTVEDPIEFLYPRGKCLISQRELGSDTRSFAQAVIHAMRQDPDVILIGEMRDLETMTAAMTAAETGHLVLTTLHTRGAAESVSRIIDVFPADQQSRVKVQLSEVLEGVISQVLLRRADGKGRVAAFEVMVGTTAIKNLIRQNQLNQIGSFIETGRSLGMRTLDQDLERLLATGTIRPEEAVAKGKKLRSP